MITALGPATAFKSVATDSDCSLISQSAQKRNDIVYFLLAQCRLASSLAAIGYLVYVHIRVILGGQIVELCDRLVCFQRIPMLRLGIASDIKSDGITQGLDLPVMEKNLSGSDVT